MLYEVITIQGDDIYVDGETITNSIMSAVEANAGSPGSLESLQVASYNFV